MSNKEKLARKNLYISKELAKWIEEMSEKTGMSQSSIIVAAIMQYRQQYEAMSIMPALIAKLEQLNE